MLEVCFFVLGFVCSLGFWLLVLAGEFILDRVFEFIFFSIDFFYFRYFFVLRFGRSSVRSGLIGLGVYLLVEGRKNSGWM